MSYTQGDWSTPTMTSMRVTGEEGSYYETMGGGVSPRRRIEDAQRFDSSRLEVTDPTQIDKEVAMQIQQGLIDANDIAGEATSADLESQGPNQVFRRKVKKMVEVPVIRKVKVPTSTPTVVPDVQKQTIMVKKQVPTVGEKVVDEAYTDIEERAATRMKEVWVKKMVPEQYMKKIEVRKSRKVKVPVHGFKEVTEEKVVEIDTTKVENQPGWRLDEIKDTKMVEIEGWQEVELVPRVKDTNIRIEKTYERQCPRRRVERKRGTNILDDNDARLDQVDTDSENEMEEYSSFGNVRLDGSERRTKPSKSYRTRTSHRFLTAGEEVDTSALSPETRDALEQMEKTETPMKFTPCPPSKSAAPVPVPPPVSAPVEAPVANPSQSPRGSKMFGLRMKAQKEGLAVSEVAPGGFAQDAGLVTGDTIVSVDGTTINTVKAWRALLAAKTPEDFLTMVVKDSNGKSRPAAVQLNSFNPAHYV